MELDIQDVQCENRAAWDEYLVSRPCGHFQQSSSWADLKAYSRWRGSRVTVIREGHLVGGFQVLHKSTRFGSIGYVSRGPALDSWGDSGDLIREGIGLLKRRLSLSALMIQPSDADPETANQLNRLGFCPDVLFKVIRSTVTIDLTKTADQLFAEMHSTARNSIRQAQRKGVCIREGGEGDLGTFFELMSMTCRRQNSRPNPSSLEELRHLWVSFARLGQIRLTFAECDGQAVAGFLTIDFGTRATLWKKGWSEAHGDRRPNELLLFYDLMKAKDSGLRIYDFAGCSRDIAERVLAGDRSDSVLRSRDWFHLKFGARPSLLPDAQLCFLNPAMMTLFRVAMRMGLGGTMKSLLARA